MSIFNSTLVRILGDAHEQQNPAGAGFIASNKHIVTCAHVVGDALGIPREGEAPPDESLWVDLPLLENSKPIEAKALVWHPVRDEVERGELEDIAVLELCPGESFPEEILPAPIIVLDDSAFFDCPVRIYGFPEGMGSGDWLAGHLQGPVSSGWIQLDQQLGQQVAASGFSGTPVWDTQENAIVGIIISTRARDGVTSAYMMPASRLAAAWPDIDAQCRAPNPYRGLQAFHVEHAANFFGRGREIEELLEAVRSNALVSVVGASGSGKSSLVLAGVAAKLQEAPEWLIAEFRPVSDPFEGLASALGPLVYPATDAIEARNRVYKKLTSRVLNIVDLVSVILQENAGKRLLIIVDQFEELYTQNRSSRQQISFLEGLLGTVKGQAQSPACSVLLAIRADFFPQLLSYGPLAEAIDRFPKKRLGLLSDEGLKSAITSPAKRLGVTLEKGLLERILRDLNRDPGILPLLEFAMTLLWERQTQRKLTHAGYDAIGGVEKALAHYADNVYRRFQERGDTLRRIFVQLVRPGEGTEDIRQVATRERMGTDNWPLVEELADGRLLVTGYSEALKTETVELAHESLIRHWRPLQEWIKAERGFRVWQNRLRQALSEWQEQQKEDDLLLCGAPLAEAEEWLEQYGDALTADEREFIEAGIRLREHEIARGKRLRWGATLGLLAITVMALAFAAFAYFSSEQQKGLRQAAEEQRDEALRKQSVLSAKLSKERIEAGSKEYGMLWALEELPSDFVTSEWPYAREAESPSYRAILAPDAPKNITELERGAERHFAFSPDGSRLVVMSLRGDRSPLLDVKTGKEIATLPSGDYADFSPDGAHVVTTSMSKIQLWNAETGEQISEIKDHEGVARIIQFIADGRQIFTASALEDGARMQIWDSQTGERVEDLKVLDEDEVFRNAAMSPDGGRLAVRVEDKKTGIDKIYLYDVASRKKLLLVNDGRGALWPWAYKKANLGFSPDR